MRALAAQLVGAVLIVAGFVMLAPAAGVIVAGAMILAFGVALERGN